SRCRKTIIPSPPAMWSRRLINCSWRLFMTFMSPPGNRGLTYKGRALGRTRTQRQANGLVGLFGRAARVDAHGRDPLPLEHLECGPGELVVQLEAALDAGRMVVLSLLEVAAAQAPAVHGIGPRMGEIVDAAAAGAVAPEEQPALEDLPRGVEQEEAVDLDPARAKSLDELERLVGRARNTVQHEAAPAGLGHPPLEHVHDERRGR